jgi:hypothetical protein
LEIFAATAIAAILLVASVLLHFQAMTLTRRTLEGSGLNRRPGALIGMSAMLLAQLLSVLLYALAYLALAQWFDIGSLAGEIEGAFIDQFYFSLASYTTLGTGDIYPVGGFRIISGIQALNGIALIGWTVSFAYTLMRDGW